MILVARHIHELIVFIFILLYRNVLTTLQESFPFTNEEFMQHIARRLKDYYYDWLERKPQGWIKLSPEGTRLGAVRNVSTIFKKSQITFQKIWMLGEQY